MKFAGRFICSPALLSLVFILLKNVCATTEANELSSSIGSRSLGPSLPRLFENPLEKFDPFDPSQDYQYLLSGLDTMQHQYFNGCTWNTAIDWTAAVLQTYLVSSLISISSSTAYTVPPCGPKGLQGQANATDALVSRYFDNLVNFYYAQDAQSLTTQKNDDMQWVILGWLEAIKFVNVHTELHYSSSSANFSGQAHVADFAHRARLFYDRVSTAYSNKTCGGGMVWDSTDAPYKNAVTNELYVAASVSMYLYLPGDNNPSPSFIVNSTNLCLDPTAHSITGGTNSTTPLQPVKPRNSTYLQNAVDAFVWLTGINMTNTAGLYVDGFHLTNTTCDQRSEDVFSYNQGVLLSGIRGLWEATGNASYLNYGHNLIHSTIVSTGYSNNSCGSLGCNGVMADTCDSDGSCSQDEQTFKGAYFHHLMLFCAPLPYGSIATILENQHAQLCGNYSQWIQINAAGAYSTKNSSGDFGGAWGASADVNGLGRGRTVETQGGAISVFNTLYAVISNSSSSVHRRA